MLTNIIFTTRKDFVTSVFRQTFPQFKEIKVNKFVDWGFIIFTTPPLRQDMIQGQFLSGV